MLRSIVFFGMITFGIRQRNIGRAVAVGLEAFFFDSPHFRAPSMLTFGIISLCFHCDVRGAIAFCNNSGGFSEPFSIDPLGTALGEIRN